MNERGVPVRLDPGLEHDDEADLLELARRARACAGNVPAAIALAADLGTELPLPMRGSTARLWESLATIAAVDLTTARVIEPHLDALAILSQAPAVDLAALDGNGADGAAGHGGPGPGRPGGNAGTGRHEGSAERRSWGVFAAESRDVHVQAGRSGTGWVLSGTKPWCSLAGSLTHAVVTARTDAGRQAFAVDLRGPRVRADDGGWTARGLAGVPSGPVSFAHVPAVPVGGTGWYLDRPGFAWGGVGVAAIWFGAASAIARRVYAHCREREADQIACLQLGLIDGQLSSARNALALAARQADGTSASANPALAAGRARAAVVGAAEAVLELAGHAMGPGPLAFEPEHAARTADLGLYLRQDHAERSTAALGRALLDQETAPW